MEKMNDEELLQIKGNEAITLTTLMAYLSIGLVSVICYRFFKSSAGKATLPGGFQFTWS